MATEGFAGSVRPRPSSATVTAALVLMAGLAIGTGLTINPRLALLIAVGAGLCMLFVARADLAIMLLLLVRTFIGFLPTGNTALAYLPRAGLLAEALIAVLLVVATILYVLSHRMAFLEAPLAIPLLVFIVAALASAGVSQYKMITLLYVGRLGVYFLIYVFVFNLTRDSAQQRDRWWKFIVGVSIALPLLGLVGSLLLPEGLSTRGGIVRLGGPFGGLEFGTLLMVPMLLLVIQYMETRGSARLRWALQHLLH